MNDNTDQKASDGSITEEQRLKELLADTEFLEEFRSLRKEIVQAAARNIYSYIKYFTN